MKYRKSTETKALVVETVFLSIERHPITVTKPTGLLSDFSERLPLPRTLNRFPAFVSTNIYKKVTVISTYYDIHDICLAEHYVIW